MNKKTGKLRIDERTGKIYLSGEVFDQHGTYNFEAGIDTGNDFGIILQRGLADAICAPEVGREENISVGAGTGLADGIYRKLDLRFGNLEIKNCEVLVMENKGQRNLIGVKFLQEHGLLLLVDYHDGKTKGGLVTSERKYAKAFGKVMHCIGAHNHDLSCSSDPCPFCGACGD